MLIVSNFDIGSIPGYSDLVLALGSSLKCVNQARRAPKTAAVVVAVLRDLRPSPADSA